MHDKLAIYLSVDDPEALEPVRDAYCVLTEVHTNFKTKSLIAIFECWRSREAFKAKRRAFSAIQIQLDTDKGGEAYFDKHGIDGAGMNLGPPVRDFCVEHSEMLREAKLAETQAESNLVE